jgi:hypothetical protein
MFVGTIDLTPLFYVSSAKEQSSFLLLSGLLLSIPVISAVPVISTIGCVDFPIILFFLWETRAMWFKEPSSGLGGLNAYIGDRKQIDHRLGLLRNNLPHCLEIADHIMEGVEDW